MGSERLGAAGTVATSVLARSLSFSLALYLIPAAAVYLIPAAAAVLGLEAGTGGLPTV